MKLLIVRHADAGDADEFAKTGRSDDERPLSDEGVRQMARAAAGLRSIVERIDILASSPLVRARQTADIVMEAYGMKVVDVVESLRSTTPLAETLEWLNRVADARVVAIVGHDPHLSRLATWLTTGVDAERVALKKGGACLLEFSDAIEAGSAMLRWLMTPSQLSACAE
jgi:phosphohistidine phosphatase